MIYATKLSYLGNFVLNKTNKTHKTLRCMLGIICASPGCLKNYLYIL